MKNKKRLDSIKPGNFDGSDENQILNVIDGLENGQMSSDEAISRLLSVALYERGVIETLKKNRPV